MTNDFLPKLKVFKEKYKETKEQDLTDDDIIAMLDEHLQRDLSVDIEEPSPDEEEDHRSNNDAVPENDEIEKFSDSQKQKLEELDKYIIEKKKELDKIIAKIKRKDSPIGETSDTRGAVHQENRNDCFEVDV